ncbi:MAG TPA: Trm112 family protein [Candidatus Angelobacter sp.]|nr:Trm112 family protein [Candidatus Angelobacter sp.]
MNNQTSLYLPWSAAVLYSVMLKQILDILVCPVPECRKPFKLSSDESSLQCTGCRRIYPIRDGIPILLIDQAKMPQ